MFTEEEVKGLESVFTLARKYAAESNADNYLLMKSLINLQNDILVKMVSTFPKKDKEVSEESVDEAPKEEVPAEEATHNVD
jgi:hypothetical protein